METIRFKWEDDKDYKYRQFISDMSIQIGQQLANVGLIKTPEKAGNSVYMEAKKIITLYYTKLCNIFVPLMYAECDKYLRESCLYYLKGFDILIEFYDKKYVDENMKKKNAVSKLNKAATFLRVGNSFITIVSCKTFELFDKQQFEYNKAKSPINNDFLIDKGEV